MVDQNTTSLHRLSLTEILVPAEDAAISEAFSNLARHCGALLRSMGHEDSAGDFEQWVRDRGDEAAAEARRALQGDLTPLERLSAWLLIRSYDSTTRRQQLSELLEERVHADFPAPAAGSMGWLRRGYSPQAALIRATAQLGLDERDAAQLASWVRTERGHIAKLWSVTTGEDAWAASEARFTIRARRDFHFRVVLGIRESHDLITLGPEDAPLALALGRVWAGDPEDELLLGQGLVDFAYSVAEVSEDTQLVYRYLDAEASRLSNSVQSRGDGGER